MQVVIVGPGAIGCFAAVRLQAAGVPVALLGHNPERARLLAGAGLTLEELSGETAVCCVPVAAHPRDLPPADLLVFCVKAGDTAAALAHAFPLIGPATEVVSLQNGLGAEHVLGHALPAARLAQAVTGHAVLRLGPARFRHAGAGPTFVASCDPLHPAPAERFAAAWRPAGLDVAITDDRAGMLWRKLVVNAAINAVCALADIPNGALLERPELLRLALAAGEEAATVARTLGILPADFASGPLIRAVCAATATNVCSMAQDLREGRRTEIDALNAAVVRAGQTAGVRTPLNHRLVHEVHGRTARHPYGART